MSLFVVDNADVQRYQQQIKTKISILALLKQFESKIDLSRNNFGYLWWLNFERQKKVNIKGIYSFEKDFGNF